MIPCATTKSNSIQYIEERVRDEKVSFHGPEKRELEERPWDVSDEAARAIAAEEELGEGADEDKHFADHAMWFIKPEENKAVLCVFRPKGDGEIRSRREN